MKYLYDMTNEEIIDLVNKSDYLPFSNIKEHRKLKTLLNYLKDKGIVDEVQMLQRKGSFGYTDYDLRIFNPHWGEYVDKDEDYVYREVTIWSL